MFFKSEIGWFSQKLEENTKRLNDGDLSSIPWIFCVFSETSDKHKLNAAKALCSILVKLKFSDICRIDIQMRQTISMEWSISWGKYNVENFFSHKMTLDEKRAIVIFSTFNPNGKIREQAVKLLSSYELTLPYIMLRQNDWVMQVRQAAFLSFDSKMNTASNEELLQSLPFVEKLRRGSRDSHIQSINTFFVKLNSLNGQKVMIAGLRSPEVLTRRVCINALLSSKEPNSTVLIAHLKYETDPFLRKLIFQKLGTFEVDMLNMSIKFLKDKHPTNRAIALQYLYALKIDLASSEALKMIFDKSAYVREFARSILKEAAPNIDIHKFYIDNLTKHLQSAILGLGEIGKATDCNMIALYLHHDCTTIVRAAMVSLMRLDARRYGTIIIEMLSNERVGIEKPPNYLSKNITLKITIKYWKFLKP